MGKVVMPKNSAMEDEIIAVLKIYYEADEWIKNDVLVQKLKEIIGGEQYHSSYTKKVQMTSYFGFTVWEDYSNPQSRRRITESGKRFYLAWKNSDNAGMLDEIMLSLEKTIFGRNNCGCSESDSDIEIPSIFIRTVLKLGYLLYNEFAFILWRMEDCGINYTDAVSELIQKRSEGNLVLEEEAKRYTDAKPIMMLIRWGFLAEDGKVGASTKIVIEKNVMSKYEERLNRLQIYNVDKFDNEDKNIEQINKYERAAQFLMDYAQSEGITYEVSDDEVEQVYQEFQSKFSPDALMKLDDMALLQNMFYTNETTNDSMCYWLEFQKISKTQCGGIGGGSSYKFGLFQNKEGNWLTGSGKKPEELTEIAALEIGKNIRDILVTGAKIIDEATLETEEDYEKLDRDLNAAIGKYATIAWVHKYFHMIFPDKLSTFYSPEWQKHVLYALRIKPNATSYGRSGQIAIVNRYMTLSKAHMGTIIYDKFGGIKHFCRLGTTDSDGEYADPWRKKNEVAIGWNNLGSLEEYLVGTDINREAITERLAEVWPGHDSKMVSRKAGEIVTFYKTAKDTVFVAMDGESLLALVDDIGDYFYDINADMAHRKSGKWHCCFDKGEKLPYKPEGYQTACYELSNEDNLMFLYEKYFYNLEEKDTEGEDDDMEEFTPFVEPVYNTGIVSGFDRNRIVFGAPGTGKSYRLKNDCEELLGKNSKDFERVTFHPDYSYSQFVGAYKPVSDQKKEIKYDFVPGPFMRIYVEAIKNGKSENPQPYLLLIEEINRANVAAVFGDVFQLLDRDDDNVSEYSIQATEDVKKYLAKELGGKPTDYSEIKIPDNMFIWASMNSADQGVFPMDTAFKRRWSFTYLGIDDSESGIEGKMVTLGKGDYEKKIEWNSLRKAINDELLRYKVNEDKLMGPYFVSKKIVPEDGEIDKEKFIEVFKSKVIMYLFDDAAKQKRLTLFEGCEEKSRNQYSKICKEFETKGISIFCENISSRFVKDSGEA